jgi:tetratricopeptide (TPR) repeat protein
LREQVTEETIAENRRLAEEQPPIGLPKLALSLMEFGWTLDRETPAVRLAYFDEAAAIYRGLVERGAEEHLTAAAHAVSSLALQYSLAHDDTRALAARHEAAVLARRVNLLREDADKDTAILLDLAHGLAEAGQFQEAVAVQLEVVDIYRGMGSASEHPWPEVVAWSFLDLAIYLELAGQTDASLEIEYEALALQRQMTAAEPRRRTAFAIWAGGAALRFADVGRREDARGLIQEAIDACDRLPAEGDLTNFGFHQALQAALLARSGTRDEPRDNSGDGLQPVLGRSLHHWAFSLREAYRAGLDAINHAVTDSSNPRPDSPAALAELGRLLRRRSIRESVLCPSHTYFGETIIPALAECVDVERQLIAADPGRGTRRLTRALTDHAMGLLVTSRHSDAGDALREAHELYAEDS